uniref:Uncharacterized protein n=1 Tax=Ditylenchus dipsaci TaxID=166011 RepID=A0A915CY76_9BILA
MNNRQKQLLQYVKEIDPWNLEKNKDDNLAEQLQNLLMMRTNQIDVFNEEESSESNTTQKKSIKVNRLNRLRKVESIMLKHSLFCKSTIYAQLEHCRE